MAVDLLPDAGKVARLWATSDADIAAVIGAACSHNLPPVSEWPDRFWLRFSIVENSEDRALPRMIAIIQWDAYAVSGDDRRTPDYPLASTILRTVAAKAALVQWAQISLPGADAYIYSNSPILGPRIEADQETGWARYRLDTELVYRKR